MLGIVKAGVLIMLMGLVMGCGREKPIDTPEMETFHFTAKHYTYSKESMPGFRPGQTVKLVFPPIPGAFFGRPEQQVLQMLSGDISGHFPLPLPTEMDYLAQPLTQYELTMTPVTTRIIRLGTFHHYPDYCDAIGGGGFRDSKSGHALLLVYFSNPAKVEGHISELDGDYTFNISVSQKGWHWLELAEGDKDEFEVRVWQSDEDHAEFTILVDPGRAPAMTCEKNKGPDRWKSG